MLLNDQKVTLINRQQAEKIANELLDSLTPEDYPHILALNRESAVNQIVNSSAVGDQYGEGYLANAVLTLESDMAHERLPNEPYE